MSDERVRLGFLLFYYWWRYVALTIFTGMGYKVGGFPPCGLRISLISAIE
jgi:hypothetical protein